MANYTETYTADTVLPITTMLCEELADLLLEEQRNGNGSPPMFNTFPIESRNEEKEFSRFHRKHLLSGGALRIIFIHGENSADPDGWFGDEPENPERVTKIWALLRRAIKEAGLPFITIGVAFDCDKLQVNSTGGCYYRIYKEGKKPNWEMGKVVFKK